MKIDKMFPKKYATGSDLEGPVTLSIARVQSKKMRSFSGPDTLKWVIYFQNAQKGVVLSRTLADQIVEAVGSDETDDWIGHQVTLYPQNVMVAGKQRIAIRARAADNGKEPEIE